MREFLKWLGFNEKVAKIVIWLAIFTVLLIIVNAFLDSIGAPYYKLTIDNLSKVKYSKILEYALACIMNVLNFLSITLLVFSVKNFKKIFKYSLLYLVLNALVVNLFDYAISQIYIIIFVVLFCFFYSKKDWKYILYSIGAIVLNILLQYVCYLYKVRFIDFSTISQINRLIAGIDMYVIAFLIVLIKEVIIKKRGEKNAK